MPEPAADERHLKAGPAGSLHRSGLPSARSGLALACYLLSALLPGCPKGAVAAESPGTSRTPSAPDRSVRPACLPGGASAITVAGPDQNGMFTSVSRNGSGTPKRFFLTDIAGPSPTLRLDGVIGSGALEAWPAGPVNRWGAAPAWIAEPDTQAPAGQDLLQFRLLRSGLAMAAPYLGSMACSRDLLQAESAARNSHLGLWEQETILSTKNLKALTRAAGTYVLVEGRIVSLGKTARTRYLNFGRNWKTDFTATFPTDQEDAFRSALAGADGRLDSLSGRAVRIRGVIDMRDGPHIHLAHPGQLTILDGGED